MNNSTIAFNFRHKATSLLKSQWPFTILIGLILLAGCSGGGAGSPVLSSSQGDNSTTGSGTTVPPPPPPPGNSTVLVNIGNFVEVPEQVVFFELTIRSDVLRSANGDVALPFTPRRVELSRLKREPLLVAQVAAGNYAGVEIVVADPVLSFIDSHGTLHEGVAATLTSASAMNTSEYSIGPDPAHIDINPIFTINLDGSTATVSPNLQFTSVYQEPTEDLVARVLGVGASDIRLDVFGPGPNEDPASYTGTPFAVNPNTEFKGVSALNQITPGMLVDVDAEFGPDGFRATKIDLESDSANNLLFDGLVTDLGPGQLQTIIRNVSLRDGNPSLGSGTRLTTNADSSTNFHLDADVDLNNLDFAPSFSALTIARGQSVRVASWNDGTSPVMANQIELTLQSLDGVAGPVVVGAVSGQYSFPLTLSPDSAFARVTGHTSVLVTVQPSTQKFLYFGHEDCLTCIVGGRVRVRGLLFYSAGEYRLVADWLAV